MTIATLINVTTVLQGIGTAPVEGDGTTYFRVLSGVPYFFQTLDERAASWCKRYVHSPTSCRAKVQNLLKMD